MSSFVQILWL